MNSFVLLLVVTVLAVVLLSSSTQAFGDGDGPAMMMASLEEASLQQQKHHLKKNSTKRTKNQGRRLSADDLADRSEKHGRELYAKYRLARRKGRKGRKGKKRNGGGGLRKVNDRLRQEVDTLLSLLHDNGGATNPGSSSAPGLSVAADSGSYGSGPSISIGGSSNPNSY